MSFFSGEYIGKIDAKGRLVLPAKIKAKLPEVHTNELMVKRGFEPCLVLYPMLEWKKVFSKVSGLNEFNKDYRKFQRNFLRGCTELELDANGRMLIPKTMLSFASIEKEVVVVGTGNRIEIWDPERYNEYLINDEDEFSELAEQYLTDE